MSRLIREMMSILTPVERRRGFVVLGLAALNAIFEAFSVISVFPFLAVLGRPQVIQEHAKLKLIYDTLGFRSPQTFLIALGFMVLAFAIFTTTISVLADYAMMRYTNMRRHTISSRLVERFLAQPAAFFLRTNSSDVLTAVLAEVDYVVSIVLRPLVQLVSALLASFLLVGLLAFIDLRMVVFIIVGFGGGYGLCYMVVRRRLAIIGEQRRVSNKQRFRVLSEAMGGIKDVKVLGVERAFLRRFLAASQVYAKSQAQHEVISLVPRSVIYLLALSGIILTSMYFVGTRGDLGSALPVLGLFAITSFRLMPSLQKAYAAIASIRFATPVLTALIERMDSLVQEPLVASSERLPVHSTIALDRVTFRYDGARGPSLRDATIEIPVNAATAFVGITGAGKTTTADLILGLLEPSAGQLLVDGVPVTAKNRRAWQNNVGYVAQHIYLSDDSVAKNIAFGVDEPDMNAVRAAAKLAQIDDFVMNEMPEQYESRIGERGVRLSGGQRQRIGIARALYHDPAVLVFDEATSHLDNATESAVVNAVASLAGKKTVIVIAHRLSTVQNSDRVFVFSDGMVVASGTFDELEKTSPAFRKIAKVSHREAHALASTALDEV